MKSVLNQWVFGTLFDHSFRYSSYPRQSLNTKSKKRFFRAWANDKMDIHLYISQLGSFRIRSNPTAEQAKKLKKLNARKTLALSEIIEDATETNDQI